MDVYQNDAFTSANFSSSFSNLYDLFLPDSINPPIDHFDIFGDFHDTDSESAKVDDILAEENPHESHELESISLPIDVLELAIHKNEVSRELKCLPLLNDKKLTNDVIVESNFEDNKFQAQQRIDKSHVVDHDYDVLEMTPPVLSPAEPMTTEISEDVDGVWTFDDCEAQYPSTAHCDESVLHNSSIGIPTTGIYVTQNFENKVEQDAYNMNNSVSIHNYDNEEQLEHQYSDNFYRTQMEDQNHYRNFSNGYQEKFAQNVRALSPRLGLKQYDYRRNDYDMHGERNTPLNTPDSEVNSMNKTNTNHYLTLASKPNQPQYHNKYDHKRKQKNNTINSTVLNLTAIVPRLQNAKPVTVIQRHRNPIKKAYLQEMEKNEPHYVPIIPPTNLANDYRRPGRASIPLFNAPSLEEDGCADEKSIPTHLVEDTIHLQRTNRKYRRQHQSLNALVGKRAIFCATCRMQYFYPVHVVHKYVHWTVTQVDKWGQPLGSAEPYFSCKVCGFNTLLAE